MHRYYFLPIIACGLILTTLFSLIEPATADDGCGEIVTMPLDSEMEQALFTLINERRAKRGVSQLALSEGLQNAARYYAADVTADDYFDLSVANNYDIYDRIDGELTAVCGIGKMIQTFYHQLGQVRLVGVPGGQTAAKVMESLDQTPSLLENVLAPSATIMGIGYAEYADGEPVWLILATDAIIPTKTPTPVPTETPHPNATAFPTPTIVPTAVIEKISTDDCNPSGGRGGIYENVGGGSFSPAAFGSQAIPATIIVSPDYDPSTPTYLAFYLHGDEGGYDAHQATGNIVNQFIQDKGWIYIAPRAPEYPRDGPVWYPWYGGDLSFGNGKAEENANLLQGLLDDLFAQYNLCRDVIFGASASGGSYFYDGYFFPTRGDKYPAFVNLHCGSSGLIAGTSDRYTQVERFSQSSFLREHIKLSYVIGDQDEQSNVKLYENVLATSAAYRALGFNIDVEILSNIGHCDDPAYGSSVLDDRVVAFWDSATVTTIPLAINTHPMTSVTSNWSSWIIASITMLMTATMMATTKWQD